MKARWILRPGFLLLAATSGWLTWSDGGSGQWIFGVFMVFFAGLAAAPFAPKPKPQPKAESPQAPGFRPHWFMLLAVLTLVIAVAASLIGLLRR